MSRDGAVGRVLASRKYGPDSIPAWCDTWVEFVAGFRLASRFFVFSPLKETNTPISIQLTRVEDPHENQLRKMLYPL